MTVVSLKRGVSVTTLPNTFAAVRPVSEVTMPSAIFATFANDRPGLLLVATAKVDDEDNILRTKDWLGTFLSSSEILELVGLLLEKRAEMMENGNE